MIIICDYCNRILDVADPETPESEDLYEILGRPNPHYICAECLREILRDGGVEDA